MLINAANVIAQNTEAKIAMGTKKAYTPLKDNGRYSFKAFNNIYYVFMETIRMERNFSVVVTDESNNVISDGIVKINAGVWGNEFTIEKIIGINNKAYLLISNTTKKTGKHRLIAKALNANLSIDENEIELTSFDFKKAMNSGNWIISISPDQKHLLVIGETPYEEKEIPSKLVYNYFDANLKSEKTGEFILPGENKKYNMYTAFVANNANLFMVRKDMTRNGSQMPTIFVTNVLQNTAPTSFMPQVGEGKNIFSYTQGVLANNSFSFAGYYDERKKISSGDPLVKGCFYYNSASCTELKLSPLNTPTENLTALNLVENENTIFMVGENYKSKSEPVTGQLGVYNYFYSHKEINAIGFENDGNKKVDLVMGRNYENVGSDIDLTPVAAVVKNKLAVLFIDNLSKYNPDYRNNNYKVPVLFFIHGNGLMEPALHFEKDFSTNNYTFYGPVFTSSPYITNNKIQMLMMESDKVKGFSVE